MLTQFLNGYGQGTTLHTRISELPESLTEGKYKFKDAHGYIYLWIGLWFIMNYIWSRDHFPIFCAHLYIQNSLQKQLQHCPTVEQLFQSEELLLSLLTKLYLKTTWSDVAITPGNSEKEKNEKENEQVSNQNKDKKLFQNILNSS